MIKSAVVAMVVIGCDCDAKMCEFIRETPPQWASVAECEAALDHKRLNAGNFSYPLVTGLCRAVPEAQMVSAPPAPESPMTAAVEPALYNVPAETDRSLIGHTAHGYTVVRDRLGRVATGTAAIARRAGGKLIDRLAASF